MTTMNMSGFAPFEGKVKNVIEIGKDDTSPKRKNTNNNTLAVTEEEKIPKTPLKGEPFKLKIDTDYKKPSSGDYTPETAKENSPSNFSFHSYSTHDGDTSVDTNMNSPPSMEFERTVLKKPKQYSKNNNTVSPYHARRENLTESYKDHIHLLSKNRFHGGDFAKEDQNSITTIDTNRKFLSKGRTVQNEFFSEKKHVFSSETSISKEDNPDNALEAEVEQSTEIPLAPPLPLQQQHEEQEQQAKSIILGTEKINGCKFSSSVNKFQSESTTKNQINDAKQAQTKNGETNSSNVDDDIMDDTKNINIPAAPKMPFTVSRTHSNSSTGSCSSLMGHLGSCTLQNPLQSTSSNFQTQGQTSPQFYNTLNINTLPKMEKRENARENSAQLRKGKWSIEEENYTSKIISYFVSGLLSIPSGTTLRGYLSELLNCDPMRITKKFSGDSSIGKKVFQPCEHTMETTAKIKEAEVELQKLRQHFLQSLKSQNQTQDKRVSLSSRHGKASSKTPEGTKQVLNNQKMSSTTKDTNKGIKNQINQNSVDPKGNIYGYPLPCIPHPPYPFYGLPKNNFYNNNYPPQPMPFLNNYPSPGYFRVTAEPMYASSMKRLDGKVKNVNYNIMPQAQQQKMGGYIAPPFYCPYPPPHVPPQNLVVPGQTKVPMNHNPQPIFQGYPPPSYYQQHANSNPPEFSKAHSENQNHGHFVPFPSHPSHQYHHQDRNKQNLQSTYTPSKPTTNLSTKFNTNCTVTGKSKMQMNNGNLMNRSSESSKTQDTSSPSNTTLGTTPPQMSPMGYNGNTFYQEADKDRSQNFKRKLSPMGSPQGKYVHTKVHQSLEGEALSKRTKLHFGNNGSP